MEKLRIKILFLIFAYFLEVTSAACNIEVRNGSPIFSKTFGKKELILPPNQRVLSLKDGEEIIAHCSSGITLRTYYNDIIGEKNVLNILILCDRNGDGYYQILDRNVSSRQIISNSRGRNIYIECNQGYQQLFESNVALEGCTNFSSFGIGAVIPEYGDMVIAGICFDFDTLKTKFVKYLAHRPQNHFVFENKNYSSGDFITNLDTPMQSLEIFLEDFNSITFNNGFIDKQKENPLLTWQEYEFLSIIQDERISEEIQNFTYILNTVWWRNLRRGSWKYFLDALHKRTEEVNYLIYTGISGKLTIPSTLNCKESETLRINNIFDVPEIIWTYVKPVKANKSDEFVVFGYNTPFYLADKETISCKDICHEIDWLYDDNFKKTHLMPAFGVMHCCRVSEIASQLDVFPVDRMDSNLSITELPLLNENNIKERRDGN